MPNTPLPVLFVSHGAPTFAVEPGLAGPRLAEAGRGLPSAQAVLVVSPHWATKGDVHVATTPDPETIHDFGGFPRALYEIRYPAKGHPVLAAHTARVLADAGFDVQVDPQRGLDHGAWVPLLYLFPDARTPVFQVSLPYSFGPQGAVALGRALSTLRAQGVLIVGSGSMTHNLYEFRRHDAGEEPYVREFTAWVRDAVVRGDVQRLADYERLAPHAARAHPGNDHFLPLLVAVGATAAGEPVQVIDGGVAHGVLSMESYVIGRQDAQPSAA
jgi:4,5-DOPA dioxygenase extradiol